LTRTRRSRLDRFGRLGRDLRAWPRCSHRAQRALRRDQAAITSAACGARGRTGAPGVIRHAIPAGWIKSDMTAGIMARKIRSQLMPRISDAAVRDNRISAHRGYLMSKASSYHTADCFVICGRVNRFEWAAARPSRIAVAKRSNSLAAPKMDCWRRFAPRHDANPDTRSRPRKRKAPGSCIKSSAP